LENGRHRKAHNIAVDAIENDNEFLRYKRKPPDNKDKHVVHGISATNQRKEKHSSRPISLPQGN
jgi:hypothetical protein